MTTDRWTVSGISRIRSWICQGQSEKAHDLSNPRSCQTLPASDFGLIGNLASFEVAMPFDGFAQEFSHPGGLWLLGRLSFAPWRPYGA